MFARPSSHDPNNKQRNNSYRAFEPLRFSETRVTPVAKPAAGPNAPAQAHDLVAAFGTEIWLIIREERQSATL